MQMGAREKSALKPRGTTAGSLYDQPTAAVYHRRLSRWASGLIGVFLIVGAYDALFTRNLLREGLFLDGAVQGMVRMAGIGVLIAVLGAVDAVCVMWPVADLARFMAARSERYVSGGIRIQLMKAYAVTHLLFLPVAALLVYNPVDWNTLPSTWGASTQLQYMVLTLLLRVMPFIQLGVVFRILSVRSKLTLMPRLLIVMALFFWMGLVGELVVRMTDIGLSWLFAIGVS